MATRPKAVIESRNGEKFSPITIAKNVLTDDGQNLHDILSDRKEDMMTPTIENSSSMFKVGQGDNVDYSSNVVNGAYESMVLKGKTMVNCIQEPSSQDVVLPYEFEEGQYVTINDTKESGALGVELKGQTLVNSFITSYYQHGGMWGIIFFKSELMAKGKKYVIVLQHLPENCQWAVTNYDGSVMLLNYTEQLRGVFTSSLNGFEDTFALHINDGKTIRSLEELQKVKPMLIEYQEGMENWDIPYIEGMTSCKMPILRTTGKNLCKYRNNWTHGGLTFTNTENGVTVNGTASTYVDYYVSARTGLINVETLDELNKLQVGTRLFLSNNLGKNSYISYTLNGETKYANNVTIQNGIEIIGAFVRFQQGDICNNLNLTIQLEIGNEATPYEPHKSSILSLPEEVVLRSLPNGVCDTFNTRTGVYTQRIGEVFLNGSESWAYNPAATDKTLGLSGFSLSVTTTPDRKWYGTALCDKMPIITSLDKVGVYNGQGLNILIESDSTNANTLKEILTKDPITVQYQLENPIVTKINLSSTLKSWNTTTHIYSEIPENTLYPTLSHSNPTYPVILKPSTKYSIVANSYSNGHTNSAINFNLGGATASTTVGNRVTTITTPSTLSNELLTMSGRGNKLNNVMVIEGDVAGDEPYFEGICDCKSPILSNIGETILETPFEKEFGTDAQKEFFRIVDCAEIFDNFGVGKQYTLSLDIKANKSGAARIYLQNGSGSRHNFSFDIPVTTEYVRHTKQITPTMPGDGHNFKESWLACFTTYNTGCFATIKNIRISTGEDEPYKSNILSCETYFDETTQSDKTIVLRSLPSGVCDTLNVETGEYVQRIGEVVLDGSYIAHSNQSDGGYPSATSTAVLLNLKSSEPPQNRTAKFVCKELPHYSANNSIWMGGTPVNTGISGVSGAWDFCIRLPYTVTGGARTDSNDVVRQKFKDYLNENPVTVQYELKTPVVRTIDVQGFPYAYENGHVILSSGSIEQSLTPTVEYSIVANRGGQIRSNQRMVERHQKQLDRLQAMVLTNLVNTQYEQTLTNLKYDLKNVREEVK